MATTHRAVLGVATLALVAVAGTSGCAFFDLSNPIIPSARIFAQPSSGQSMDTIDYTLKLSDGTIEAEPKEAEIEVNTYPGDGTPGVYLNAYSAEYLDQAGKPIPTITLTKVNFGISGYLPAANAGKTSQIKLTLPIVNQQVSLYGQNQVFDLTGSPHLNPSLIHTINCSVTLYGQDDNFNQVQTQFNVPIRFTGKITT